jgi:hypothetical protein
MEKSLSCPKEIKGVSTQVCEDFLNLRNLSKLMVIGKFTGVSTQVCKN